MEQLSILATPFSESIPSIIDEIVRDGYAVRERFLSPNYCKEVRDEIADAQSRGVFRPASVGKNTGEGEARRLHPEIRRDGTLWFEAEKLSPTQERLWTFLEAFRHELNQALFLGLWDFEGHYAVYPPGAFYRKHFDRFKNDSKRTVSSVFFFNENWKREDGGQLSLDLPQGTREVLPESGTAVFFLSDRIAHEVMETHRERMSFAGWFRTR